MRETWKCRWSFYVPERIKSEVMALFMKILHLVLLDQYKCLETRWLFSGKTAFKDITGSNLSDYMLFNLSHKIS